MKWPVIVGLFLQCILQPMVTSAQPVTVEYSFGFRFDDGIYLSYEDFRQNSPSVTRFSIIDRDGLWLEQVDKDLIVRKIAYTDRDGQKKVLKRKDIWGMSHDGQPYYFANRRFHKILKVGAIMYLTIPFAGYTEINTIYESPRGQVPMTSTIFEKPKQLIDYRTGRFYDFSPKNLMYLIGDDQELYESFISIPGHVGQQHNIMRYIQEYNERHPIYFPVGTDPAFNCDAATEIDLQ